MRPRMQSQNNLFVWCSSVFLRPLTFMNGGCLLHVAVTEQHAAIA
jgi:hypothetical protein